MAQRQNASQRSRVILTKKKLCGKPIQQDAVQFYSMKIIDLKQKIRNEEREQLQSNLGICFVVFKSKQISLRFKIQSYLTEKLKRVASNYERKVDLMNIKTSEAILESDIIW